MIFFSNVGSNLDRKIGSQHINFRQYLINKNNCSFLFAPILKSDVRKEMLKLKINKAIRPDDINSKVIRASINVFVQALSLLYNLCISTSTFPADF